MLRWVSVRGPLGADRIWVAVFAAGLPVAAFLAIGLLPAGFRAVAVLPETLPPAALLSPFFIIGDPLNPVLAPRKEGFEATFRADPRRKSSLGAHAHQYSVWLAKPPGSRVVSPSTS